jgi:outer membrane protein assembly factor BamE (lipoprotein component of BamABCDE complex)
MSSTYGQKIEADKVSQIVKGTTTRDEILSWFGQPMQSVMMPDGGRTMYFVYYRRSAGDVFKETAQVMTGKHKAGGANNLSVVTDKDGIVRDYEYSAGSQ